MTGVGTLVTFSASPPPGRTQHTGTARYVEKMHSAEPRWPVQRLSDVLTWPGRIASACLFVVLAALATAAHRWLLQFEGPISRWARSESFRIDFATITYLGATELAIGVATVLAALTWRKCRSFALVYPATLVVGLLLNVTLKAMIGRPRPPDPAAGVALASFPSGHTLQATLLLGLMPIAVYLLSGRRWLFRTMVALCSVGIVAVGWSRIHLGAHWPTDVIGGFLVGAALILVAERVLTGRHVDGTCPCRLAAA